MPRAEVKTVIRVMDNSQGVNVGPQPLGQKILVKSLPPMRFHCLYKRC